MRLIGLTGPAGAGKDTVARFLCDTQAFVQIALADPIRDGLTVMLGLTEAHFTDRAAKETVIDWIGKSPRQLMQTLGTEWGRQHVTRDLWLRVAQREINACRRDCEAQHIDGVVVSDIRFEDEADWIRAQGGEVWHIVRPGVEGVSSHCSENGIEFRHDTDREVCNIGTLDVLHERIAHMVALMGGVAA